MSLEKESQMKKPRKWEKNLLALFKIIYRALPETHNPNFTVENSKGHFLIVWISRTFYPKHVRKWYEQVSQDVFASGQFVFLLNQAYLKSAGTCGKCCFFFS